MNTKEQESLNFWDYKFFLFNNDWSNFYKFNTDLELSNFQKKLLKARYLCKKNDYESAIDLLSINGSFPSSYFEADRLMVLGMIYLFKGEFDLSLNLNLKALDIFLQDSKIVHSKDIFNCYYNSSVCASRLRLDNLSSFYLEKAQKFTTDPNDLYLVKRSLACYYSNKENFQKAFEILSEMKFLIQKLSKIEKFQFNLIAADIYIRGDEFIKAKSMYDELKSFKYIEEKDRYFAEVFFYQVLTNFENLKITNIEDETIEIENLTEYELRLSMIKSLLKGNNKIANKIWQQLILKNNTLYGEKIGLFKIETFKLNSFARCIEIIKVNNSLRSEIKNPFKEGTYGFKLTKALLGAKFPMSKEALIEITYKISYSKAYDTRFYKLIERVKKEINKNIEFLNGAYRIIEE